MSVRTYLVGALLALCAAAPAQAATRHTAPGANGPEPCTAAAPCAIDDAVAGASDGDTVVVGSGSYGAPADRMTTPVVAGARVEIAGESGKPRPVLYMNAVNAVRLQHPDASLRWLEVDNAGGGAALHTGASLVDQVVAHSSAAAGAGCTTTAGTIRNSVCRSTGASGAGVDFAAAGSCGDAEPWADSVLQGVTAWASGPTSHGVSVRTACAAQKTIRAVNTIIDGTERDLLTETDSNIRTRARIETDHSNFNKRATIGVGAEVTLAHNQTAVPVLANPAAGDFHQLASSPTVNAGAPLDAGASDFEGTVRAIEGADIGADELQPAPAVTTGDATAVAIDSATLTGQVNPFATGTTYYFEYGQTGAAMQTTPVQDAGSILGPVDVTAPVSGLAPNSQYQYRLVAMNAGGSSAGGHKQFVTSEPPAPDAPTLGGLKVAPKAFAIGSRLPGLLPARRKAPTGTTISFTLSDPATVTLSFVRLEPGRRVGGKCRAQSRSNRKRPRCTRRATVRRTIRVNGRAGLNSIRFQGRFTRRERLAYGDHEVTAVAVDSLSRATAPRRASFRVVRR